MGGGGGLEWGLAQRTPKPLSQFSLACPSPPPPPPSSSSPSWPWPPLLLAARSTPSQRSSKNARKKRTRKRWRRGLQTCPTLARSSARIRREHGSSPRVKVRPPKLSQQPKARRRMCARTTLRHRQMASSPRMELTCLCDRSSGTSTRRRRRRHPRPRLVPTHDEAASSHPQRRGADCRRDVHLPVDVYCTVVCLFVLVNCCFCLIKNEVYSKHLRRQNGGTYSPKFLRNDDSVSRPCRFRPHS